MNRYASVVENIDKLCRKKARVLHNETPVPDLDSLRFDPSSCKVDSSWFGDAVLYGNKICRLKLNTEFGDFQQAIGVTATQSGLIAVVDYKAKEVIIYRKENGDYERLSSSKETTEGDGKVIKPLDVAETTEGKLIISDMVW